MHIVHQQVFRQGGARKNLCQENRRSGFLLWRELHCVLKRCFHDLQYTRISKGIADSITDTGSHFGVLTTLSDEQSQLLNIGIRDE